MCQRIFYSYPVYVIISTIVLLNGRNYVLYRCALNQFYAIIQYAINQYHPYYSKTKDCGLAEIAQEQRLMLLYLTD